MSSRPGAEDQLFDVVDHLNQGRALVTDAAERRRAAGLNRRAGDLARARAAFFFSAAAEYFNAGLDLFDAATGGGARTGAAAWRSGSGVAVRPLLPAPKSASNGLNAAPTPRLPARAATSLHKALPGGRRYREGVKLAEAGAAHPGRDPAADRS